ncbi:T9SS type A sorting domain-containing protein [Nonlabens xiamenensis]|uniref:T9SS type A sorting domain-containing protein n=1 Tax=Nonlabens xiamenensis TaxID=2341043 RepID=UPI000F612F5F|nr:T9SS type A sorting domain-containing protein [Nonlabens xiamenensis]
MKFVFILLFFCVYSTAQNLSLVEKIKPMDQSGDHQFGNAIDITGDLMIVGDRNNRYQLDGTLTPNRSGAAYIYRKDVNDQWQFEQKLVFPGRPNEVSYGWEVEIDGDLAFVSAIFGNFSSGSTNLLDPGYLFVYAYDASTSSWSLLQQLQAPTQESTAYYGRDFSYQNGTLIVGEPWQSLDPITGTTTNAAGAVHVYKRATTSGLFTLQQTLVAPNRVSGAGFGWGLDFDQNRLIVGAAREMDANNNSNVGAAYYFEENPTTGFYNFKQRLLPANANVGDFFGHTICTFGSFLAISSPEKDIQTPTTTWFDQGLVYLYKFDSTTSTWTETQQITTTSAGGNMKFGLDMDLENDRLVVGSHKDRYPFPTNQFPAAVGSVWYFELDAQGIVDRSVQRSVYDDNNTNFSGDFGYACAISGDLIAVGAIRDEFDENAMFTGIETGASFVYHLNNTADVENHKESVLIYPNPVKDWLQIEAPTSIQSLQIRDINGRLIHSQDLSRALMKLDLSTWKPGIYLLTLVNNQGNRLSYKIIKE